MARRRPQTSWLVSIPSSIMPSTWANMNGDLDWEIDLWFEELGLEWRRDWWMAMNPSYRHDLAFQDRRTAQLIFLLVESRADENTDS